MTSTKKLQVPWLLAPAWKDFNITKGLGHHRVPVGIILAANKDFDCYLDKNLEQANVRLLNDGEAEGFYTISVATGGSGSLDIGAVSVPFLECEYLDKAPEGNRIMRMKYPSDSKILPIYHFGDDEDKFFQLWDNQRAEFAYVESEYFGLLIPQIDKEFVRKLPGGKDLDDLIVFYDNVFTTYSKLIGLSFEETGTNQNVRNRFFLKCDKKSNALAKYNFWSTHVSKNTMKDFWLDIEPTNWGALHEIAHGHELAVITDESLSVIEVWNNILVVFYQAITYGREMAKKASKQREMNIVQVLKYGAELKNWDGNQKLSFLVHIFLKAGQKSFARFNQLIRKEYAGQSYYAKGLTLLERLMHIIAIEFEIDVYPFMKLAKAEIGEQQLFEHYYVLSSVAYPLNHLITDTKVVNKIKNQLGLLFETSLVTPSDLSSTNLKNDFTLKIDPQIFEILSGNMFKFMDGSRTVAQSKILGETMILKDVPIGVYKVFIEPNSSNTKLVYDDFYAVVHANKANELLLSAKEMKLPSLLQDKIRFLGINKISFATLSVNTFKKILSFSFFLSGPHDYFSQKKYASINIRNENNEVIFSKRIEGDSSDLVLHNINIKEQLEIEIFHLETECCLKFDDPLMDVIIDRTSNTNYFVVNELGFQKKSKAMSKELREKSFLNKIEFAASKIKSKISLYVKPHCQPKYNLLLAVEAYERLFNKNSVSKKLRDQYKDCLPSVDADVTLNSSNN